MRSTWKRALSTILTVCMIASLLVVPAAAVDTTSTLDLSTQTTGAVAEGSPITSGNITVYTGTIAENEGGTATTFADDSTYSPTKHWVPGSTASAGKLGKQKCITVTTNNANAKLTLWWSTTSTSSGKNAAVYTNNTDSLTVYQQITVENVEKGAGYKSDVTLGAAGTYHIMTNSGGSNVFYYKVELVDNAPSPDANPLETLATTLSVGNYSASATDASDAATAKAEAQKLMTAAVASETGVTATVQDGGTYTAATAGTATKPQGAAGSFAFTVTLSDGSHESVNANVTMDITPVLYAPAAGSVPGEGYGEAILLVASDIATASLDTALSQETEALTASESPIRFYLGAGDTFKLQGSKESTHTSDASGKTYTTKSVAGAGNPQKGGSNVTTAGAIPDSGTYYKFVANKDGKLELVYKINPNKTFVFTDGTTTTTVESGDASLDGWATTVDVTAGSTYYAYALATTKLNLYGFAFWPVAAAEATTEAETTLNTLIDSLKTSTGDATIAADNLKLSVELASDQTVNAETTENDLKKIVSDELAKTFPAEKFTILVTSATFKAKEETVLLAATVDAGSIEYAATITNKQEGASATDKVEVSGVVSLLAKEAAPVDANVTGAVTKAPVGEGDQSATLAPDYAVSGTPGDKVTNVTIGATKLVKHPQSQEPKTEGFWLGFGMENTEKKAYTWKYGKTAETMGAAGIASVKDRYVTVGDKNYNTVYVEVDKDLTEDHKFVMQQCTEDGATVLWTYNVTVDPMPTLVQDYAITKAAATNGSFTVKVGETEVAKAQNGAEVTITPTADAKYKVGEVTVGGEKITATEGVYKFTMPAKDVEVAVTFVEKKLDVTVTQPTGLKFDNTAKELTVTVKDGETTVDTGVTKEVTVTEYKKIGSETAESPAPTEIKNAGTYTVTVTAKHADYVDSTSEAVTFTVAKADKQAITFTDNIPAEKHNEVQAADAGEKSTVTFTVGGVPSTDTDGKITVTADPAMDTTAGESLVDNNNGTWTATFADANKDVKFTASYAGDDNHEAADPVQITIHVVKHGQQKTKATFAPMSSDVYTAGYSSWEGKPAAVGSFWTTEPTFTPDEAHPTTIKVAGTLAYVENFTGFNTNKPNEQEGWYLPWQFAVPTEGETKATITIKNGESGASDKTWDMATQSSVLDEVSGTKYFSNLTGINGKSGSIVLVIDWDGAGENYTETQYTLDLTGVTFEGKDVNDGTFTFANLTDAAVSTKTAVTAVKTGYQTYEITVDAGNLTAHKRTGMETPDTEDAFWVGVGLPQIDFNSNSLFVSKDEGQSWTHIGGNNITKDGHKYSMTYTSLTPEEGKEGATRTLLYKVTKDNASGADEHGEVSANYTVTFKADKLLYPDYNITAASGIENGTVTFKVGETAATKAKAGDVVEIVPAPAEGYEVATVTMDGEAVTAADGKYTFTMPAKDVEVTVTFQVQTSTTRTLTFTVAPNAADATITDVKEGETAKELTEGKLVVEKTSVVTFKVTPAAGKEVDNVKVGDTAITATEGVYTVTAGTADATVTVTMKDASTPVQPMWPDLQYKVTDTLGADGTTIAGGTVVETVEGIKLTYGGGTYAKQTSASGGNEAALVTASGMEAMVKGSAAPKDSNNIPTEGTFYKFEATKNGELMIAYAAFSGKDVVISEQEAGATTATRVPGVGGQMADNANKGETINVKAGNTYYIYALESKVCLYGFSFEAASATAPVVDIEAPANDELVEGKTLQLTATVTPADATLTWESDTTAVATVDATGKVTAVAPGTAVITVTATKNGETGTDAVTIKVIEAGVFILNPSTDLPGDTDITESQKAGTGDYFNIIPKVDSQGVAKTKTKASGKTFDDDFKGTQRLEIGGEFKAADKGPAVGFTTSGPATVKVWWIPNGAGREVGIFKAADGSQVAVTTVEATETTKSNPVVSELTLANAGEYLLGATGGNVYIFKIQVTDKASAAKHTVSVADAVKDNVEVDPSLAAEGDTVTVTVTPPAGKVLDTLTYTAEGSSTPVDIDKTTKTFTMPAASVTVSATFKEATAADTGLVLDPADYPACVDKDVVSDATVKEISGTNFGVTNVTMRSPAKVTTENPNPEPATPTSFELAKEGGSTLTFTTPAVTEGQTIKVVASLNSNNSSEKGEYTLKAGATVVKTEAVGTTNEKADYTWELQPETTYTLTSTSTTRALRVNKLEIKVEGGTVDKTALTDAITAAKADLAATVEATDAANVDEGTKWALKADRDAYQAAIDKADGVAKDANADQAAVDAAVAELAAATTTFKAAQKDGTKVPEADKTELNAAIAAVELTLSKATVADNGDEVLKTDKWITPADKTAVETAIATAKEVAGNKAATEEEVTAAIAALNAAVDGKFKPGTKEVSKADLEAAIDAAKKASDAITVAEDASDVTKGTEFVKKAVKDAYDAKIADAQAVIDALGDKTDEQLTAEDKTNIENALHALNEATHTFELAKEEGTKSSGGYRPSGGGSSAGTGNTKTETLPDGTKRVTETKRDGTVTVTDTKPDGTKVVTTTKPDGTSTTTVTLGHGTDKTVVSVPVADANTGMVAVIVKPDGTEEIIRGTSIEDGEVVFPMTESGEIKIVNNAKHFVDIDGHWAEDDVNFVTARELFNGVDATHFAPDATMTRGMMATVLFRLDGENKSDKTVDFSDVKAGDWFADAVEWAAEVGVINGYTDGTFAPNKSITRQELVVMVYRYAGAPKADAADMTVFSDVDEVADWATEAMNWAVKTGIINGRGNGILDPKGNATRAEVSAVLERFVKLANQ